MSKWSDFYFEKCINPQSIINFANKYAPFLSEVAKPGGISIEFGAGTGLVSRLTFNNTYQVLLDNDYDMLALARVINSYRGYNRVAVIHWDILESYYKHTMFNVAHSHGVLEHFNDGDIRRIVRNMRDCASSVVCYVPSSRYTYKSFGDERLLTPKAWKKICNPKEIIEFNDGYDLILKW